LLVEQRALLILVTLPVTDGVKKLARMKYWTSSTGIHLFTLISKQNRKKIEKKQNEWFLNRLWMGVQRIRTNYCCFGLARVVWIYACPSLQLRMAEEASTSAFAIVGLNIEGPSAMDESHRSRVSFCLARTVRMVARTMTDTLNC
jgi:hypothetical protein